MRLNPLRLLFPLILVGLVPRQAQAIPAWARKYNANCSMCHAPAVPRLNAKGIAFKWAGYRMPEEIGERQDVEKIQEYLAARARAGYEFERIRDEGTTQNRLGLSDASIFIAGPIGRWFGGFTELQRTEEGEVEALLSVSALRGSAERYVGARFVQGHALLLGGGVAGFDRAIGISTPLPFGQANTALPVRLAGDMTGGEAFVVLGRNRFSVQLLNSALGPFATRGPTARDVVVTNQLMWDDAGAGLGAAAYFGQTEGLVETAPERRARYARLALTANKYFGPVELLGGYVYSRDRGLPAGEGFAAPTNTGQGYWVSGQVTPRRGAETLFLRYEENSPDRNVSLAAKRFVAGAVLPINVPEYLRAAVEYRRGFGGGTPRSNGLAAELQLTF